MLLRIKRTTKRGYLRPLRLRNNQKDVCELANNEEVQINIEVDHPLEIYHGITKKQRVFLDSNVSEIIICSSKLTLKTKLILVTCYVMILLIAQHLLPPLSYALVAVLTILIYAGINVLFKLDDYQIKLFKKTEINQ